MLFLLHERRVNSMSEYSKNKLNIYLLAKNFCYIGDIVYGHREKKLLV